jgi:Plasmid recombination enzyme
VAWLAARHGGEKNILSADIHRDEPAPHLHLLMLPLIGGRMNGSDALGGRTKLAALHNDFHSQVAAPYGLKRAPARLQGNAKAAGIAAVLNHMRGTSDPAMRSAVWGPTRESIERDPAPFLAALGIGAPEVKAKALRSMTAIFTSKGKGSAIPETDPYRVLRAATA